MMFNISLRRIIGGIIILILIVSATLTTYFIWGVATTVHDYAENATRYVMSVFENTTMRFMQMNSTEVSLIGLAEGLKTIVQTIDKIEPAILQAADRSGARLVLDEYIRRERELYEDYQRLLREVTIVIQHQYNYVGEMNETIAHTMSFLLSKDSNLEGIYRAEHRINNLVRYTQDQKNGYNLFQLQYVNALDKTLRLQSFLDTSLQDLTQIRDENDKGWSARRRILTYGSSLLIICLPAVTGMGGSATLPLIAGLVSLASYDSMEHLIIKPATAAGARDVISKLRQQENLLQHNKEALEANYALFRFAEEKFQQVVYAISDLRDIIIAGYVPQNIEERTMPDEYYNYQLVDRTKFVQQNLGELYRRLERYLYPKDRSVIRDGTAKPIGNLSMGEDTSGHQLPGNRDSPVDGIPGQNSEAEKKEVITNSDL
jgi:hypothetical protein